MWSKVTLAALQIAQPAAPGQPLDATRRKQLVVVLEISQDNEDCVSWLNVLDELPVIPVDCTTH